MRTNNIYPKAIVGVIGIRSDKLMLSISSLSVYRTPNVLTTSSFAPTPFNRLFRQPAEVPPLRPRVAIMASAGILTGCPSDAPPLQRVLVRPRLTLIRLALIRNPWPFGVRVSHPHCRYLCLHLLFRTLENTLR